jgi:hypothetical protein
MNWDDVSDNELLRQQYEIRACYPVLARDLTTADGMRPLLAWVEGVDLIKGDDDKLGAYNWSYTAKHIAERDLRTYISNSHLIMAAIMCGYLPNYVRATNCDFKRGWWYDAHKASIEAFWAECGLEYWRNHVSA